MKEISATDAARGFAEMLDAVEHLGESFLVRRNGRTVARIEPATGATGVAVKDLLTAAPRDPDWQGDLRTLRTGLPAGVTRWDAWILDTSVVGSVERGRSKLDRLLLDDDDVAIAAITAAELRGGVALADERRRPARTTFVEQVLATIPVEDYDLEVARAHADLLVLSRGTGRTRGAPDLLIAATAVARDRELIALDRTGFDGLGEVRVRPAS